MNKEWLKPIYKRLAKSELGTAGHTSGIVPTKKTASYFGEKKDTKSHLVQTVKLEFWYLNYSTTIKTNVNYFKSKSHDHIHLTGNLLPMYKKFNAKPNDLVLFWRSKADSSYFKAELIKQGDARWHDLKKQNNLKEVGNFVEFTPPGALNNLDDQTLTSDYQILSRMDKEWDAADFPSVKRKGRILQKERKATYRSKVKGDFVLNLQNYKCQINKTHHSFLSSSGKPYMEKHHLISMKYYEEYENDLDDINNIVSLCPNCHRQIHLGEKTDITKMLKILWKQQDKKLRKSNLGISLSDLYGKYVN